MKRVLKVILTFAFSGVLAVALLGCSKNDVAEDSEPPKNTETVEIPDTASIAQLTSSADSFEGGVLTTEDWIIEITECKVVPIGSNGNENGDRPLIVFWYKITNLSGEYVIPIATWDLSITAYQDDSRGMAIELDISVWLDEKLNEASTEELRKNSTVESVFAYELNDTTTPVELIATDLLRNKLGSATYSPN